MYHEHWGLERSPFVPGQGRVVLYEGESHVEAAARLRFVVRHSRSALMMGLRGVGKTLLVSSFAAQCRREGREVAAVSLAGLAPREFLWQVAGQLALSPRPEDDVIRLFRRLDDYAAAARWRSAAAVLLLDDADQAGPDLRLHLSRLTTLGGGAAWLSLVLAVARGGGAQRLGDELLDAADLRVDLEPWTEAETVGYVQHALLEAGADRPIFEDEALSVLFTLTEGVPRQVNRLADHALLGAAASDLPMVDAATIESAHEALGWIGARSA